MDFIKNSANKTPIVDTVFAVVEKAKEAKAIYGDAVIDATIGSLYNEEGTIVAFKSVFDSYNAIPNEKKAGYAASFRGNEDFRKQVKEWTLGMANVNLPSSVIATPGGTGAIALCLMQFLEENEAVLVPDVAWGNYATMATDQQLQCIRYEMFDKEAFNLNDIKVKVNQLLGKQERIVLIVNDPCHNPTGYSMTKDEWRDLIEFLNEASKITPIILLNDIAYIDYAYDLNHSRDYMKVFENINNQVMVAIAMSCSKTMTSYGMRCGAVVLVAKDQQSVIQAQNVFEKSARATWSNVNNAAMLNFSDVVCHHYEDFIQEKNGYIDLLKERSSIFVNEANVCGLPIYPYKEGFFVTIVIDNENKGTYHEALMKEHIYTVQVNKGIRVAICSLPIDKARGLAYRMKQIYDNVVSK